MEYIDVDDKYPMLTTRVSMNIKRCKGKQRNGLKITLPRWYFDGIDPTLEVGDVLEIKIFRVIKVNDKNERDNFCRSEEKKVRERQLICNKEGGSRQK